MNKCNDVTNEVLGRLSDLDVSIERSLIVTMIVKTLSKIVFFFNAHFLRGKFSEPASKPRCGTWRQLRMIIMCVIRSF